VTHTIPDPGFAGDVGDPDPALLAALAAYADAATPTAAHGGAVFAALHRARLLVPIVAVLESRSDHPPGAAQLGVELGAEKESAMATVVVDGGAGRRALLAFTGVASLAAWRVDARPAPVLAPAAARSALAESADTLLVDPAGPVPFAVAGADLRALALSDATEQPTPTATVDAVLRSCLRHLPDVESVHLDGPPTGGSRLVVAVTPGLDESALGAVVDSVAAALRDDVAVRAVLPDGVQLAIVPASDTPSG
jgi:hypothetical protein